MSQAKNYYIMDIVSDHIFVVFTFYYGELLCAEILNGEMIHNYTNTSGLTFVLTDGKLYVTYPGSGGTYTGNAGIYQS